MLWSFGGPHPLGGTDTSRLVWVLTLTVLAKSLVCDRHLYLVRCKLLVSRSSGLRQHETCQRGALNCHMDAYMSPQNVLFRSGITHKPMHVRDVWLSVNWCSKSLWRTITAMVLLVSKLLFILGAQLRSTYRGRSGHNLISNRNDLKSPNRTWHAIPLYQDMNVWLCNILNIIPS